MNKLKLTILLISTGQPSLNPRLVKEADVLAHAGYNVIVLYSYWNNWGTELDKHLIPSKRWKAVRIGGDPQQQPLIYFLSRFIHKLAKIINRKTRGKLFPGLALARSAYFLSLAAKKSKADLYIGHNLGALPVVVEAAKKHKKPCGFDAEDFHRNEVSDVIDNPDVVLKSCIEEIYLPQVDYLSTSSPLISEAYKKIFPAKQPVTILNT
ncbi:MAG TPA: hypothetical protein VL442_21865, partial [Mucilaginibacter sp.]|nr:hypothetical protein [Mucilaginibacter sp.]